ncbi:hypothetical protein [Streptomyces sp. NBC_01571]|uniref:hypothetical protein n=1 Tax=unclassified Streptomyces TaxID=2593676 RepID=UPI002258DE9E|nr:hypothetical protein [Streptomyces sp. NBC_01571]MCX4572867.1 hypothetical protein [Streptomyces sp. NBC_01571]
MKERDADRTAPGDGTFERVLDRALHSPEIMAAMEHSGAADTRERLRDEALKARAALSRTAAAEYGRYLGLRAPAGGLAHPGGHDGPSDAVVCTEESSVSVSALLLPSLGVVAAGVYVLSGFDLRALDVRPHLNDGLIMVVVILAAVTAGAALGDLVWSLATRRRPAPEEREPGGAELRQAHLDWQLALLERSLIPFLLGRLDGPEPVQPAGKERPNRSERSFTPGSAKK